MKQVLASLGSSVREVVETLRNAGITGKPRSCSACPIAKYLHANGFPSASVGTRAAYEDVTGQYTVLPYPVRDFINEFDLGDIDL